MNKTVRKLSALYWGASAVIMPYAAMAQAEAGSDGESSWKLLRIVIVIALAFVITLALAPVFYKRALEKKGERQLTGFLLNDPATRDLLIKKKQEQRENQPSE